MDQLMLFASGNHRNVPKTVARRYQLKAHSEQPLDINACSRIAKGDVIVVGTCEVTGEPIFGLVDSLTENGAAYLCRLYETSFDAHYHAYRVSFIDKALVIVPADILVYKLPVGRVRNKLNVQYLCLRHTVI